mgnify:CR=1 FL=1
MQNAFAVAGDRHKVRNIAINVQEYIAWQKSGFPQNPIANLPSRTRINARTGKILLKIKNGFKTLEKRRR